MVGESVTGVLFGNRWKPRKIVLWEPEKPVLGILSFEVSRLMSKVVSLWQFLTDRQLVRLREEVANSVGMRRLVSEDDDYLMDVALAEILENLRSVGKSVALLGKKCLDKTYHNLESIFDDPAQIDPKWYGWHYRVKKMEKKVKKMDKFVSMTEQLYLELEVLAELEQAQRRMRAGAKTGQVKLPEFQQKVVWQRQEVKNLREMSPWVRTYDYTVRLLVRSLFTIIERIKYVYGINPIDNLDETSDNEPTHGNRLARNDSRLIQASVYPSENTGSEFPIPLGRSSSNLGSRGDKTKLKNRKSRRFAPVGFAGCVAGGIKSPVVENYAPSCGSSFRLGSSSFKDIDQTKDTRALPTIYSCIISNKVSFFNSKRHLLNAGPSSLGYAALALHYSNMIILIEKLAASPNLISLDARDDLYSLLPASIRGSLWAKLKKFSGGGVSTVCDAAFAEEWSRALAKILEWLSPLAHNMIRWQSERNFDRQRLIFGSNVLLVQTLYFANQAETEAAIVELLVGLNYLYRFGQQKVKEKPYCESSYAKAYDHYFLPRNNMHSDMIAHAI